jgi:hypothetical protein
LPEDLQSGLDDIARQYTEMIPDKNIRTHHAWYSDLPPELQHRFKAVRDHPFWQQLCDGSRSGSDTCVRLGTPEMDELYYSNPPPQLESSNLYGNSSNFYVHRDCYVLGFSRARFYRIVVGLTDGNNSVVTHFTELGASHKINKGDYLVFDFDRTFHRVTRDEDSNTNTNSNSARMLLKIHFLVCEDCTYSPEYLEFVRQCYIYYDQVTRAIMRYSNDPESFGQFFVGLLVQTAMSPYLVFRSLALMIVVVATLYFFLGLRFRRRDFTRWALHLPLSVIVIHILRTMVYWIRYNVSGVR